MNETETGEQQRINEQLLRYWQQVKGKHPAPRERDIDIATLQTIWPSCFLVKYQGANTPIQERFSYLHLGSDIVSAYGDELSQREVCETLIYPSSHALNEEFQRVIDDAAPIKKEAEFTNQAGLNIKYRSIMLPLMDTHNQSPAYILGGMRWKSYL